MKGENKKAMGDMEAAHGLSLQFKFSHWHWAGHSSFFPAPPPIILLDSKHTLFLGHLTTWWCV
jgi:hypothetical protein